MRKCSTTEISEHILMHSPCEAPREEYGWSSGWCWKAPFEGCSSGAPTSQKPLFEPTFLRVG